MHAYAAPFLARRASRYAGTQHRGTDTTLDEQACQQIDVSFDAAAYRWVGLVDVDDSQLRLHRARVILRHPRYVGEDARVVRTLRVVYAIGSTFGGAGFGTTAYHGAGAIYAHGMLRRLLATLPGVRFLGYVADPLDLYQRSSMLHGEPNS